MDDWLICAPSRKQSMLDTQTALNHMGQLGLQVNLEKSNLVPSQETAFLGMVLNSVDMTARPSPARVSNIMALLLRFKLGRALPYVLYLRLLAKLTAAAGVVPLGLLPANLAEQPPNWTLLGLLTDARGYACLLSVSSPCPRGGTDSMSQAGSPWAPFRLRGRLCTQMRLPQVGAQHGRGKLFGGRSLYGRAGTTSMPWSCRQWDWRSAISSHIYETSMCW